MKTIYTIGYDGWTIDEIEAIRQQLEAGIIDIRWKQFSPRTEFQLEELLKRWEGNYLEVPQLGNTAIAGEPRISNLEKGMEIISQYISTINLILLCRCGSLDSCHRRVIAEEAAQRFQCEVIHLQPPTQLNRKAA